MTHDAVRGGVLLLLAVVMAQIVTPSQFSAEKMHFVYLGLQLILALGMYEIIRSPQGVALGEWLFSRFDNPV